MGLLGMKWWGSVCQQLRLREADPVSHLSGSIFSPGAGSPQDGAEHAPIWVRLTWAAPHPIPQCPFCKLGVTSMLPTCQQFHKQMGSRNQIQHSASGPLAARLPLK